jgi:hypothetical protein
MSTIVGERKIGRPTTAGLGAPSAAQELKLLESMAEEQATSLASFVRATTYWGPAELNERHRLERLSEQATGRVERAKTDTPELRALLVKTEAALALPDAAESASALKALMTGFHPRPLLGERVGGLIARSAASWLVAHGATPEAERAFAGVVRALKANNSWSADFQLHQALSHEGYLASLLKRGAVGASAPVAAAITRLHGALID